MEGEIKVLFDVPGEFILQRLIPLHLLLLSLVGVYGRSFPGEK